MISTYILVLQVFKKSMKCPSFEIKFLFIIEIT